MDILKVKPGEAYRIDSVYFVVKEPSINSIEDNKTGINLLPQDEVMVLQSFIEENDAFWIYILGINREAIGWIYVWFNNKLDLLETVKWERIA